MKVVLIQIPHFFGDDSRVPIYYPIGIGYLASMLKEYHDLIPMDLWVGNSTVDEAMQMISKTHPDVFCISVYSTQYPYFKELVSAIRKKYPNKKIIAGGPGATFSYQTFLEKTQTDFCVIGEGENTLKELLDRIDSPEEVSGIAFRKNGSVFLTKEREQIKDLDSLPLPDRTFFDMERYICNAVKVGTLLKRFRVAHIIAGRGCPYNCTFCSKTFHGIRLRSVKNIMEEIEYLKKEYSIKAVGFNDELVVINKKRILELCSSLKNAHIKWGCQGRINLVDEEILKAMKAAGCLYVGLGVESVTQRILDNMKKSIKCEEIVPAVKMTKAAGLKPVIQYMYGFPGEDDHSIESTYNFFKEIDHPYIGFTTTPIPGTEIYKNSLDNKVIDDEEAYLMKIVSGYNGLKPIVNLTMFSDEQFVSKKTELARKVNRAYYKRHPGLFIKELMKFMNRQLSDPKLFLKKLRTKLFK